MAQTSTLNGRIYRAGSQSLLQRMAAALLAADARYKARIALQEMSARELEDIGLTDKATGVHREIARWNAPSMMLR
ncbi:DUF1127 domain-containing protein [Algicella marina]|uniref:DUF1127 domain-containing protein n=1 Tax=Algicella marina TaxID=2683284 RepID=A0A6P1T1H2_9RHOB|nr:DUF1127 domain-containing protein [Algicella marina]QHQ35591.1 DUF1127 domain-containing protein [Algicella marina]